MQNEMNTRGVPFPVQKGTTLPSESTEYLVLDFMGEGVFGKVAKCVDLNTQRLTAIKILKASNDPTIEREVEMLKRLGNLGHEKNVVQFIEQFLYQGLSCLAFEMLDISLCDLVCRRGPLTIQELRPITKQLLVALEALRGIRLLHTDLKPDNIMLVNHQEQPFKVKLIDFGLARLSSEANNGQLMQPVGYRAPEVTLGLPICQAIDIWGLGCVLASLFLGCNLFPVDCPYRMMQAMCHLLGQPEDHMLNNGWHTWTYFTQNFNSTWRLNTPREYEERVGYGPQIPTWALSGFRSLDEAVLSIDPAHEDVEYHDRLAFLDLLKRLLATDPDMRITSSQAQQHCFVTMAHLEEHKDSVYADSAFNLMSVCNSEPLPVAMGQNNESSGYEQVTAADHNNLYADVCHQDHSPESLHILGDSVAHKETTELGYEDLIQRNLSSEVSNPEGNVHDVESSGHEKAADFPFPVVGDLITTTTTVYEILDFMGEGSFGRVAKCADVNTHSLTAVKILTERDDSTSLKREVEMLREIQILDTEKKNLVRFIDHFKHKDLNCLAFEMLDRSLWDLMNERKPLSVQEIRPIAQQLLVAFEALKGIGILHADLKPDNIMLVNHQEQPFRVKLIDFGLAIRSSEVDLGMLMQIVPYRAPEVNLGLPINEAADMWALGCVLAYLFFGTELFPVECPFHAMRAICQLLGQPTDELLAFGEYTDAYFTNDSNNTWRINSPRQYKQIVGVMPEFSPWKFNGVKNLGEAVESFFPGDDEYEHLDRMTFLNLLKGLLCTDPRRRITPTQALNHRFVTMTHLKEHRDTSLYADSCFKLMSVCHLDEPQTSALCPSESVAVMEPTSPKNGGSDLLPDSDFRTGLNGEPSNTSFCETYSQTASSRSHSNNEISELRAETKSSNEDCGSAVYIHETESTVFKAGACNLQRALTYTVECGTLLRPIVQDNNNVCLNIVVVAYEDRTLANPNTYGSSDISSLNNEDDVCTADNDDHLSTDLSAGLNVDVQQPLASAEKSETLFDSVTSLELQLSPVITTCTDAASLMITSVTSLDSVSEASARPGSADGAAAVVHSDDSATEANTPDHVDVADMNPDGVKKKKKPFRRIRKFASRVRKGVVSIFKPTNNNMDTNPKTDDQH